MVGAKRGELAARLPYIGLDIESAEKNSVRVEYSPNRPDFGTDFGIARAMRGLLGKEVGLPKFTTSPSGISMSVDRRLSKVRPFIACAAATGLRLDEEDVRQIISLQEDLHNGLGRRRRVVAIGLHDLDAVSPPFYYRAVGASFRFVPLGGEKEIPISSILSETQEGRTYGPALGDTGRFPVITDSRGTVLSFPPVINGNATRLTKNTRRIFVDVTSTDRRAGDDVLAVLATTLAEAGGRIRTVRIGYPGKPRVTPDLSPVEIRIDYALLNSVLGMELSRQDVTKYLARSRLGVKGNWALGPRYRTDLLHPVDIAEEVALGYGVDKLVPAYPPSKQPGSFNHFEEFLDSASTVMAGAGFVEVMTFELTDEESLYANFQRSPMGRVAVLNPKSLDHSLLRDDLLPPLMAALSGNVKSDYPQRIFEIGRVYRRSKETISEAWHLGGLVAHAQSTFTEAKMYLESACRTLAGMELDSKGSKHWAFSPGRCAEVTAEGVPVGYVGEVEPRALAAFGIGVPVSGFELDLSVLYELLK